MHCNFFNSSTYYCRSDLINPSFPFSPLEVSAGKTRGFHEQLDEQPQRFFPQPTLVFPSLFRKHTLTHTHTHTHSHIVAFPLPCPQSPTLCQQTCCDHDVIISPIARPYACERVAVYRKILSGGFHRTCELTTVSTLVHVCIIGIKMSGFSYSVVCGQTNSDSHTFFETNKCTWSPIFIVSPHCRIQVFNVLNMFISF